MLPRGGAAYGDLLEPARKAPAAAGSDHGKRKSEVIEVEERENVGALALGAVRGSAHKRPRAPLAELAPPALAQHKVQAALMLPAVATSAAAASSAAADPAAVTAAAAAAAAASVAAAAAAAASVAAVVDAGGGGAAGAPAPGLSGFAVAVVGEYADGEVRSRMGRPRSYTFVEDSSSGAQYGHRVSPRRSPASGASARDVTSNSTGRSVSSSSSSISSRSSVLSRSSGSSGSSSLSSIASSYSMPIAGLRRELVAQARSAQSPRQTPRGGSSGGRGSNSQYGTPADSMYGAAGELAASPLELSGRTERSLLELHSGMMSIKRRLSEGGGLSPAVYAAASAEPPGPSPGGSAPAPHACQGSEEGVLRWMHRHRVLGLRELVSDEAVDMAINLVQSELDDIQGTRDRAALGAATRRMLASSSFLSQSISSVEQFLMIQGQANEQQLRLIDARIAACEGELGRADGEEEWQSCRIQHMCLRKELLKIQHGVTASGAAPAATARAIKLLLRRVELFLLRFESLRRTTKRLERHLARDA